MHTPAPILELVQLRACLHCSKHWDKLRLIRQAPLSLFTGRLGHCETSNSFFHITNHKWHWHFLPANFGQHDPRSDAAARVRAACNTGVKRPSRDELHPSRTPLSGPHVFWGTLGDMHVCINCICGSMGSMYHCFSWKLTRLSLVMSILMSIGIACGLASRYLGSPKEFGTDHVLQQSDT